MELRKLNASDYDELLELLNKVFTKQNRRPMDFLRELPKMWVRDDKHMGYHTGIFEDDKLVSVAGCYPLSLRIGDTSLLFATTGNVATLPEYEGRGYFNTIFEEIMKELEQMGADGARLGGDRQRYARFGYEPAGCSYNIIFNEKNRLKCFQNVNKNISFRVIEKDDVEALEFCNKLSRKSAIYVERSSEENYRDVYLALCSLNAIPYLACKNGTPIGYLAAITDNPYSASLIKGRHICELRYDCIDNFIPMICAWQQLVGCEITFKLAPHMLDELQLIVPCAEHISVSSPSLFKIMNYEKVADALMKLQSTRRHLQFGEFVLKINDYGNLRFYVGEEGAGCMRTEATPDIVLDNLMATRFLFGYLPVYTTISTKKSLCQEWFPLPLSWNGLDYV